MLPLPSLPVPSLPDPTRRSCPELRHDIKLGEPWRGTSRVLSDLELRIETRSREKYRGPAGRGLHSPCPALQLSALTPVPIRFKLTGRNLGRVDHRLHKARRCAAWSIM